jgi:hypothetical protein
VTQADFESLLFIDVADRAAVESPPPHGKPKYYGRPWLQLRDEMVASGARTVAELPAKRIAVLYHATRPRHGGAQRVLRGLFGGASSR